MHVCPECASTLCVPLCGPGDRPVFVRCMLCETTFLARGGDAPPISLGAHGPQEGHQVKIRVTASGRLEDPLGVARRWAREIASAPGGPAPVGVGAITEQAGMTEVTLLLMLEGVPGRTAAQEAAGRRCAAIARTDPRVRDIRPVVAIALAPGDSPRVPAPVRR